MTVDTKAETGVNNEQIVQKDLTPKALDPDYVKKVVPESVAGNVDQARLYLGLEALKTEVDDVLFKMRRDEVSDVSSMHKVLIDIGSKYSGLRNTLNSIAAFKSKSFIGPKE